MRHREPRSRLNSLIVFTLLYFLLTILVLFFARQILMDVSTGTQLGNAVIIPLGIVLPAFLLGSVLIQALRLLQDKKHNRPGSRFKLKLVIFFAVITLFASLPQMLLSLSFIDTAMQTWFSSDMEQAMSGGIEIALAYNSERVSTLTSLAESSLLRDLLRKSQPETVWQALSEMNPTLDGMQFFDSQGKSMRFFGDPLLSLDAPPKMIAENGIVPKEFLETVTIQRVVHRYRSDSGAVYQLVFSSRYIEDFGAYAENLTRSRNTFRQYAEYKPLFRLVMVFFFAFFSFPVFLLAILISFQLSNELIRPVVSLEEATRKAMQGDFSYRILGRSRDELSNLTASFNRMMSELENSRRTTLQTEKVTAWQEIAQRLAHEIRNPLTPIKLSAQRILRRFQNDPASIEEVLEPSVQAIVREVENLDLLLTEFRSFARLPRPSRAPVRLLPLLKDIADGFITGYPEVDFNFSSFDPEVELPLDREQISRVFTNLFKNSIEAMESAGRISIRNDLVRKGNTSYCRIQVEDNGCGIPEDSQREVFNPYYTSKSDGTGLGLPIVERIIFDHQGQIWFESAQGLGTTFFIDLPLNL